VPLVLGLPVDDEEHHCHDERGEEEDVDGEIGGVGVGGGRGGAQRTILGGETWVYILDLAKVPSDQVVGGERSQDEEIADGGLENGEENSNPRGQFEFLVVVFDLQGAFGCAVAYRDGLIIHAQPAAGANNRDFSLEILPESKFSSMAVQLRLGDACGEVEDLSVAFYLLTHGILNQTDLDSVGFDYLAHFVETAASLTGALHNRLLYKNQDNFNEKRGRLPSFI
jgi:hypothetical protein